MTELAERDGAIVLPARMDIAAAGVLRDAVLARTRDLVLDASDVTLLTSPALQVLMAARDHQREGNRTIRIVDPSPGFASSIAMLGVPLDRLQTAEPGA